MVDSVKNYYSKENVNVAMGPRTGNESAHKGKRAAFKAAKEERAPLAKAIEDAYSARKIRDYSEHDQPGEGAISENTHVKKFKASKK
jgi:hypothetical protein